MKLVPNCGAERVCFPLSVSSFGCFDSADASAWLGTELILSPNAARLERLDGDAFRAQPTSPHSADLTATAPCGRNQDRVSA